jgi:hypothetical protein
MEKFGLVDKTKEELIDIALQQQETEQQLKDQLENANANAAQLENDLKERKKSFLLIGILFIALMIYCYILIVTR